MVSADTINTDKMKLRDLKSPSCKLDNLDVFFAEHKLDFGYELVNSVKVKTLSFMEEPNGKVLAKEKVLILDKE